MNRPQIAARSEWMAARKALLAKEKVLTRELDALAAERRELPMVLIDKTYVFDGADGQVALRDLFGVHRQLMIYHFMFDPAWEQGCPSCSHFADNVAGAIPHLGARSPCDQGVAIQLLRVGGVAGAHLPSGGAPNTSPRAAESPPNAPCF